MNCIKTSLLALLAVFTVTCQLCAQPLEYQFSTLNIFDGLSNNQVNSIHKDSKGFMWFGTRSGLNRYDGYHFKVFNHDAADTLSLADDFISGISEAPGRKLFIRTRNGNSIYDQLTEKFIIVGEYLDHLKLPTTGLKNIIKTSSSFVFIFDSELWQYKNGSVGRIRSFINNNIADIKCDSRKNLVVVYTNGLIEILDGQTNSLLFTSNKVKTLYKNQFYNYSLFIDNKDNYWLYVATDPQVPNNPLGVILYEPSADKITRLSRENNILNNDLINGITQDDRGKIWIGTDHGGINILDPKTLVVSIVTNNPDNKSSLAQNTIYTLYKDDRGIIWAGTYKKGISYYHERLHKFPLYTHQPSNNSSLPFSDVNKFVEDQKGNIWIGTNGGGLIYFDRSNNTYKQYRHSAINDNSIGNDVIVSMCIDHENKLWIGSYFGGLDCFDGKTFVHYKHTSDPASLSDDRVWEIFEDSEKNLWVGTLTGGLNKFDRKKGNFIHYSTSTKPALIHNYISALVEDDMGRLWIGTSDGLDVMDHKNGKIVHFKTDNSGISDNYIICLKRDHAGRIWAGTRNGISVFDPQKQNFISFNVKDGLPDKNILNIEEDDTNNMWVSTPNGVSRISVKETAGRMSIQCQNYDELDGLQGRSFNENASFKTRAGEIIFGGANGFNIFHPSNIVSNNTIPPIVLTNLQISNTIVTPGEKYNNNLILTNALSETEEITLRYYENDISIDFSALSYTNTEKNSYAYLLEGFNDEWIKTSSQNRRAVYTNLDPGEYFFRVKGSNEDGLWNENGASLKVTILPPFWKTNFAYVCYAILIIGSLIFSRQMIIRRARMRFAIEQERKEAHRLHELDNMKIRFFTNVSHEFRTPLALILSPLGKIIQQAKEPQIQKQLQMVHRNARRLLNMVNQLLDFRKLEEQELKLNTANGDILRALKEICYSFTDLAEKKHIRFSYQSQEDSLVTQYDGDKLERILFNLLSNAFKFTPENGEVTVNVTVNKKETIDIIEIEIKDSGIGISPEKQERIFDRFYQDEVPASMLNQGSGIGLSITRDFVKMMDGSISVKSVIGHGSTFKVQIPFERGIADVPAVSEDILYESVLAPAVAAEPKLYPINAEKRTILLVEDHEDFRFYLKESLQDHYNIIEAGDGKSVWQKILSSHPDLVVSDITMPEMNGIELCRKIKSDARTKQLPVILLTALTDEEQQLNGLRTGVTDYMTKPFNVEILLSRIQNILEQQTALKKTYSKLIDVKSADIEADSPNEKFIQRVLEIVEKNISNPDFSVEELSHELFMSRAATYKRIFSITGKPPIEFIRSIRLQRAAQLLIKTKMTVSEIAYEVGFNNPKYFTKYFKAEFKMVPSAYVTGHSPEQKTV